MQNRQAPNDRDDFPASLDLNADISVQKRKALPHWTQEGVAYFVTFRLCDSLPRAVSESWLAERMALINAAEQAEGAQRDILLRQVENLMSDKFLVLLDNGHGACTLKDPIAAKIVSSALNHFDDERYRLWAWSIMPNHVHVVLEPLPGQELGKIVASWKSFTANKINKHLGREGSLWQREAFDHAIRNQGSFEQKIRYTLDNPAAAGLHNWPWIYERCPDASK